jgi:5-methylcytosine-specific restriction endonuclease McrA
MMNLKNLSDSTLLENTKVLVSQEQELLINVLHHLREIDRRRLFSSLGYKSLFEFTEKHLGYPQDQAYRRIAAMKLLRELPEIETKISQGEINLTHIGMAKKLFKDEKLAQNLMTAKEKLDVFEEISKTSTRVAEKIILSKRTNPEPHKPDKVRAITEDKIELKFQASIELQEKIEKLKGRLAHKHPNLSLGELFDKLCDLGLETWDPGQKPPRKSKVVQKTESSFNPEGASDSAVNFRAQDQAAKNEAYIATPKNQAAKTEVPAKVDQVRQDQVAAEKFSAPRKEGAPKIQTNENSLSCQQSFEVGIKPKSQAQIRREVFQKAQNQCENCSSNFALEIDHIRPKALGGDNSKTNLRLLCRSCNQRAAIKALGVEKMDMYLTYPLNDNPRKQERAGVASISKLNFFLKNEPKKPGAKTPGFFFFSRSVTKLVTLIGM